MSLVATWCYCSDGFWYEEPVWIGKNNTWFLCLDDDEDPELVVRVDIKPVFPNLDWFQPNTDIVKSGERIFGGKFHPAWYQFGNLIKVPPPPQKYESKGKKMLGSHWYDLRKVGNNE